MNVYPQSLSWNSTLCLFQFVKFYNNTPHSIDELHLKLLVLQYIYQLYVFFRSILIALTFIQRDQLSN